MAESWRRATAVGPYGMNNSSNSSNNSRQHFDVVLPPAAPIIDRSRVAGMSPTRLRLYEEELRSASQRLAAAANAASGNETDMLRIENAQLKRDLHEIKGQYAAATAERQIFRRQVEELSIAKDCEASAGRHDRGVLLDENRHLKGEGINLRDQLLATKHEQAALERTVADLRAELVQNNRVLVDQNETVRALTQEMSRRNPAHLVKYQRESQTDAATISDLTRRLTEAVMERDRAFGDVKRLEADLRSAREEAAQQTIIARQRLNDALQNNKGLDQMYVANTNAQRARDVKEIEEMRNEYERRIVALQNERANLAKSLQEARQEAERLRKTYEDQSRRLAAEATKAKEQLASASSAKLVPITIAVQSCRGLVDMRPTEATVVVYDNYSKNVLTTDVVEGTNPTFDPSKSKTLNVPDRTSHSAFTVDVYHYVTVGTEHQFLGRAIVPLRDIVAVEDGTIECRLMPREGEVDPVVTKARSLGYVTLKIGRPDGRVKNPSKPNVDKDRGDISAVTTKPSTDTKDPSKAPIAAKPVPVGDQHIAISIISGTNLINRDPVGTSDPVVLVKDTKGNTVFKSEVCDGSLNPTWTNAVAYLTVPANGEGHVSFEVWDDDFGSNDAMGFAKLPVKAILESTSGTHVLQLGPREKETDAELLKAKSLGSITVNIIKIDARNANSQKPTTEEAVFSDPKQMTVSEEDKFKALRNGIQEVLIYIRGCSNILSRDTIGGESDVFVTLLDTKSKEIKRTPVVTSKSPQWPMEKASIRLALDPADNGMLTFEVWDEDLTYNDFLGLVSLSPTTILARGSGKASFDLQPRPKESDKTILEAFKSSGLGKIHLEFTVSDASRAPTTDGKGAPASLGGMYDVVARIHSADGLLARDIYTSDPFVMVYDGDDDSNRILKTPCVKSNCNPVFPSNTVTRPFRVSAGGGDKNVVRFEVWDEDTVSNDFLGEARVTVSEIIANMGGKPFAVTLQPRVKENDKTILKHHDKLGRIIISFSDVTSAEAIAAFNKENNPAPDKPKPEVKPPQDPRECLVHIASCSGLLDRDTLGNHSDPFVRVYYVSTEGKPTLLFENEAKYVEDNPNPTWSVADASFNFTAFPNDEGTVRFEVWDKDITTSDFLGCIHVPVKSFVDKKFNGERTVQLTGREKEKESAILDNIDKLGTITVNVSDGVAPTRAPPKVSGEIKKEEPAVIRKVCIVIESASDLVDVEGLIGGVSDPFVVVKEGSTELLRTPSIDGSLNPKWPRNKSSFNYTANSSNLTPLTFTVYDENTVGSHTFMGVASLSCADIAKKGNIRHALPLQLSANPKENSAKLRKGDGNVGTLYVTIYDEDGNVGKGADAAEVQLKAIEREKAAEAQKTSAVPSPPPVQQKDALLTAWVKGLDGIVNTDGSLIPFSKDLTDAFVNIIGPDGKLRHTCPEVPNSLSPRWEKAKGSVQIPVVSNSGQHITFRVLDVSKMSKDEDIAEITVSVDEALKHIGEDWRQNLKCNNSKFAKSDPGTITLRFDY